MARADLLLKLVKAGSAGDKNLLTKGVESLIAEERNKQHHIVADQLADGGFSHSLGKILILLNIATISINDYFYVSH